MTRFTVAAVALIANAWWTPVDAQETSRPPQSERLGTVHFPNSCARLVAPRFDRAVALLHSFEFGASTRAFNEVLASDSTCAMAWWGIALNTWGNPMTPNVRPLALLTRGHQAATVAARFAVNASPRERDYVAAIGQLYADLEQKDQRIRVVAYEKAMEALAARYPDDAEARIFHAISLVGAAPPTDKTYANQLRAGAILEGLFASQPDHPGLSHYIIHAYDVPALAGRAKDAASRYASIAPSAAHALHMPSHTFTRVGMWNESVRTNLRSRDEALRNGSLAEALHAMDYTVYANLQMRRDSLVREMLGTLPEMAARFDPRAVTGAAPGSAGVFALAAMPARYALERRAWSEAAALVPKTSDFPYTEALTYFAIALGRVHIGDTTGVMVAIDSLGALAQRLVNSREVYWAEQVAIQRLGAEAWLAFARGRRGEAIEKMTEAATREDATEKSAVTPGPLAPARELLGDMLLELGRPTEALAAYRAALTREPNRYRSVRGAHGAAQAAGDTAAAAAYARAIERITGP